MPVRRLTPADWQLLREVRLAALRDSPEAFSSSAAREAGFDAAEWRRRAGGAWFVATDADTGPDDVPVGIVAGFHDDTTDAGQRHLVAMWVAPSARGSGIAAELVEAVVEWARADGASEVTLGVIDTNQRARALYERCGFVAMDQQLPLAADPQRHIDLYRRPV